MTIRLYVVHNSHPCTAVAKALELKGLEFKILEWPPPMHKLMQLAMFGSATVPAITIDGEKVLGSRKIFHRLDQLQADPPLYPVDNAGHRAAVESADRWGDEVFQQVLRDLLWAGVAHDPSLLVAYSRGSHLPLPGPVIKLVAPSIVEVQRRLNRTGDKKAAARMRELPRQIAKIDQWIHRGTIGDPAHPNAADLQILSTVRLLDSLADVRPHFAHSRAPELANQLFGGPVDAELPAGLLPQI
jgi:glutathione S-transferase